MTSSTSMIDRSNQLDSAISPSPKPTKESEINGKDRSNIFTYFLNQIALSNPFQTDSRFEKFFDSFFLKIFIVFILIHIFAKLKHLCRNFLTVEFRDSFYSFDEGFKPDSQS